MKRICISPSLSGFHNNHPIRVTGKVLFCLKTHGYWCLTLTTFGQQADFQIGILISFEIIYHFFALCNNKLLEPSLYALSEWSS